MQYDLAVLPVYRQVHQNVLVDLVVVEKVVGARLIEPDGLARIRISGKNAGSPFVVSRPQLGIPDTGISGSVIDEIRLGVV
jgi:hypothetical protein